MACKDHLQQFAQGVAKWNRWRQENPCIRPDLSQANLAKVNAQGIDFSETNLIAANLSKADLTGSQLTGAILSKAILTNAILTNAVLKDACLEECDLTDAILSKVILTNAILKDACLGRVDLTKSCLDGVSLEEAVLSNAQLYGASLKRASLKKAILSGTKLYGADLEDADLEGASLASSNLGQVNFKRAKLRYANLEDAQACRTDFSESKMTGTRLGDCHFNNETKFDRTDCTYIYLTKESWSTNSPKKLEQGELFALLYQSFITIDLIFSNGIDWQAFAQSFQDLRCQYAEYAEQDFSIQAIKKKPGGTFIVCVTVTEGADKALLEGQFKEIYKTNFALMEQRYRAELQAKDGEIAAYRKQSANLMEIVKLQASRPITVEATAVVENNTSKYNLRNAQFAGGFAETVQGDQVGGTIYNQSAETPYLTEAAAEIRNLLKQLEASNPMATETEQMAFLNVMIPSTRREQFIRALRVTGGTAIEEVPYRAVLKALVEGWQRPNG